MHSTRWTALDKFRMKLQPDWFDIHEMICSAPEARQDIETIADHADGKKKADTEKEAVMANGDFRAWLNHARVPLFLIDRFGRTARTLQAA